MRSPSRHHRGERGATLVEFTLGAFVFLSATFGVIEVSRLLWTHNALSDATRRAARYAVINPESSAESVKNVAVYGNPEGAGARMVNDLDTDEVVVEYEPSPVTGVFGYPDGKVTVSVTGYVFNFAVPVVGTTISMPDYRTTLTAESAGVIPGDLGGEPTPTPSVTPTPTPAPAPTPTPAPTPGPSPTPAPTPRACDRGENVSTGCVCQPPMRTNGAGKCQ